MNLNPTFDPCSELEGLDLNDRRHLAKILTRDKHTRIEGLCTEALFVNDLLVGSFPHSSSGWWFIKKDEGYRVLKLQHEVDALSELDLQGLSFFVSKGLPTFVVSFDEQARSFLYLPFRSDSLQNFVERWSREKKVYPKKKEHAPLPDSSRRDPARLQQAIDLLESFGLLRKSAIERLFANCYIGTSAYWDLDALVSFNSEIVAFEVKQKFPSARGTFGLNSGLCKLFSFLRGLGVRVYHIILTKPIHDESIPALDFYAQEKLRNLSLWIGMQYDESILDAKSSRAPAKTSIFTSDPLRYYHIEPERFHYLKELGVPAMNVLSDFLTGKTRRLRGLHEIPVLKKV
jgi:hypothetical protein